jgi:Zn-finger nucleic acid-binding protein
MSNDRVDTSRLFAKFFTSKKAILYSQVMEKDITCPKCKAVMTSQGVKSVGAGASRLYNVEIYLCPQCGCIGRWDQTVRRIVEIPNF